MHDHPHDHTHEQAHTHNHSHTHDPEEVKAIANRLARAIGHLECVRQMVLDGRDCAEVLTQLSAVRSALNNAGVQILKSHMEHCMVEAVAQGDTQAIEDLSRALERYLR
ncbi:MAG: metal-sensing transcriptional repressor [Candidatus Pelethousia sp.]|nr:metal-sensing transcriptional repressor [Candidatus Pelethousia sp.]